MSSLAELIVTRQADTGIVLRPLQTSEHAKLHAAHWWRLGANRI